MNRVEDEIRRRVQSRAQLTENLSRIRQSEKEVTSRDQEIEKLLLTIQSIIDILRAAGYLAPPEEITER